MKMNLQELQARLASLHTFAKHWDVALVTAHMRSTPSITINVETGEIHDPVAYKKELDKMVLAHLKTVYQKEAGKFERIYQIICLIEDLTLLGMREAGSEREEIEMPIGDGGLHKMEDKCPTCDKVFAKARNKCTIGLAVEGDYIESHSICGECLEALSDMNSEQ